MDQKGYLAFGCAGYRCRMGEIDLIAQKGRELAFVEVKLRRNARFAATPGAGDCRKTAAHPAGGAELPRPVQHPEYGEHYCRFDVAEVYAPDGLQTAEAGDPLL